MSRTHEDMDKKELIGIIKRLSIQNNDWYVEAKKQRRIISYWRGVETYLVNNHLDIYDEIVEVMAVIE